MRQLFRRLFSIFRGWGASKIKVTIKNIISSDIDDDLDSIGKEPLIASLQKKIDAGKYQDIVNAIIATVVSKAWDAAKKMGGTQIKHLIEKL